MYGLKCTKCGEKVYAHPDLRSGEKIKVLLSINFERNDCKGYKDNCKEEKKKISRFDLMDI